MLDKANNIGELAAVGGSCLTTWSTGLRARLRLRLRKQRQPSKLDSSSLLPTTSSFPCHHYHSNLLTLIVAQHGSVIHEPVSFASDRPS